MVERLGIAITTYNRRNQVVGLSAAIRLLASTPIDLVICDDGSSDNTVKTLLSVGETVIGGRNGGIARNKNRGIWYLLNRTKADAILLLDDDVLPVIHGWEQEWLSAVEHYGHVNFSYPSYRHCVVSGSATAADPALATMICGCALAFSREVIASLGFMDPRFGRYGHEHSDLSFRAVRAGYGGFNANGETLFCVIDGGLEDHAGVSSGTHEDVERNGRLLAELGSDPIYRHAWRDDVERAEFLSELRPLL